MGGDCLTSEKSPPPAGQGTCPGHAAWGLVLKGPVGLFGPGMASAAAPGHLAIARRPARPSCILAAFGKRRGPAVVDLECTLLTQPLFLPSPLSVLLSGSESPETLPFRLAKAPALCRPRSLCIRVRGCRAVRWPPGHLGTALSLPSSGSSGREGWRLPGPPLCPGCLALSLARGGG